MFQFRLDTDSSRPPNILLLGAHCDDIEIGCGGTLLQLVRRYPSAKLLCVTLSSTPERAAESRAAAARVLAGALDATVRVESFRGSYFPYLPELKDYFEELKAFEPDLVLTHYRHDLHQDHACVCDLTWNTFRDHAVLEYEIPKYDGDLGAPNVFVPLSRADLSLKCDIVTECFRSQSERRWFTRDTFQSIARLRGMESNAPEGYAEAFYSRKLSVAV
jgi:LmbE family N-acetylglucosaminyl deacetylase